MKSMVVSEEYRHVPMRGLALLAQRVGSVFASVSTWAKQAKTRGWLRPRLRQYPAKPKLGVRARKSNEIWHIDLTVLRLLDGTRAYVHAVIDNFSRRVLAWTIATKVDPTNTCKVLREAGDKLLSVTPSGGSRPGRRASSSTGELGAACASQQSPIIPRMPQLRTLECRMSSDGAAPIVPIHQVA